MVELSPDSSLILKLKPEWLMQERPVVIKTDDFSVRKKVVWTKVGGNEHFAKLNFPVMFVQKLKLAKSRNK